MHAKYHAPDHCRWRGLDESWDPVGRDRLSQVDEKPLRTSFLDLSSARAGISSLCLNISVYATKVDVEFQADSKYICSRISAT